MQRGEGSQGALDRAARQSPALSPTDRGLATELVYGVLRQQRVLDHWLSGALDRGLQGIDPAALIALRLGLYQLAWLDRVPDHAAIAATIDENRDAIGQGRVGFVNAVLRRLSREQPWTGQAISALPPWIAGRVRDFAAAIGESPDEMERAFEGRAPLHVHVVAPAREGALAALAADGVEVASVGEIPGAFEVVAGSVFAGRLFEHRQLIAQDAASAAVAEWVGAGPGLRVADIAAGRGAKSLFLAAAGAEVTAVDIGQARLDDAEQLAAQSGTPLAGTLAADASSAIDLEPESFDLVLLDAPCSGLGTIRRRPEIRHRRGAVDLYANHGLQLAMARRAADLVRPGGVLIFAVCSFAHEEGPLVVERLLAERPDLQRAPKDDQLKWADPLLDTNGDFRSHPLWYGVDAFYAARLLKK
ncbi:MAG: methyltransferase domain-containing protein [Myxococcales bacterium]|nr:methyltransferase domain-containing protein [Myxococcales bacterium]